MKSVVIAAGLLLALGGAWGIAQESKEGRSGNGWNDAAHDEPASAWRRLRSNADGRNDARL